MTRKNSAHSVCTGCKQDPDRLDSMRDIVSKIHCQSFPGISGGLQSGNSSCLFPKSMSSRSHLKDPARCLYAPYLPDLEALIPIRTTPSKVVSSMLRGLADVNRAKTPFV